MHFLNCIYKNSESLAVLSKNKDKIVLLKDILNKDFKDMNDFIENFTEDVKNKIYISLESENEKFVDIREIKILSPIPKPRRSLFCLGKNYFEHMKELSKEEIKRESVENPIYFLKMASETIGTNENIIYNESVTNELDYEVELVVIIGKTGKNIKKEDVKNYIFGYTVANDVTARDLQSKHKQWAVGKSLDTFCPIGPYIVYKDEISYPPKLNICSKVNDEIRQESNTSEMMFDIDYIVSDLSKGITLRPGDIILTGTPKGVGKGFNPPRYLKDGDVVECYVENIGTLINKIHEEN